MKTFVLLHTTLAGAKHHLNPATWAKLLPHGTPLDLEFEPENEFDKNAIRLMLGSRIKAGYIPATLAPMIGALLKNGHSVKAEVDDADSSSRNPTVGIALLMFVAESKK